MAGIRLIRGDREMPPLLSASAVSELTEAGGRLEEMHSPFSARAVSVGALGGPHGGSPARIAHHANGHGDIIIHCASLDVLCGLPDNMLKQH